MDAAADETMSPAETGEWDTTPQPWRRYGARILDVQLFGGVLMILGGVAVGVFGPEAVYAFITQSGRIGQVLLFGPLSWMLTAPFVALCLAKFGTTPGKLLFGLRVVPAEGGRLGVARAMQREARLLVWGAGFALPLISLITMITSYEKVTKGAPSRWDEDTALTVEARRAQGWQLLGIVLGALVVLVALLWSAVERLAGSIAGL